MSSILLIEPDYVLARTYRQALAGRGRHINLATTAQAAILTADRSRPDLVILEIQLVEHSGIEFLYEFRSYPDWQNIPVIIHSQVPPSEFADSWQLLHDELGVHNYLYKPHANLQQLNRAVSDLILQPA